MIVQKLMMAVYNLFDFLTRGVHLPSDDTSGFFDIFNIAFDNGLNIFRFFVPQNVLKVCIPIFLGCFAFRILFAFIKFVVKKIPLLNIDI